MAINKIVKWNLEERVEELKSQNKGNAEISRILTQETGKPLSNMSVSRYLAQHKAVISRAAHKSHELQEQIAQQHIDVTSELIMLLDDIKTSIEECKQRADISPDRRSKLYAQALKGLEIVSKRLGDIDESPKILNITVRKVGD